MVFPWRGRLAVVWVEPQSRFLGARGHVCVAQQNASEELLLIVVLAHIKGVSTRILTGILTSIFSRVFNFTRIFGRTKPTPLLPTLRT